MRCLCCNKIISENADADEIRWGWHKKCVRRFFGTAILPHIDLSENALNEIVTRSVSQGLTIPGVQKKMSLHLTQGKDARLTLVNYPTGYILKLQTDEYQYLPEYEHMAMLMAEAVHIRTVPHALRTWPEISYSFQSFTGAMPEGRVPAPLSRKGTTFIGKYLPCGFLQIWMTNHRCLMK